LGSKKKRQTRARLKKQEFARAKQKQQGARNKPPEPVRTIRYQLSSAAELVSAGPLIGASWMVPVSLERALQIAARPVPTPVHGMLLIDTGASGTCISEAAAQTLGLHPVRTTQTYGAAGLHPSNVYEVRLRISIEDPKRGLLSTIDFEVQAIGVPDLEKQLPGLTFHGEAAHLIGLLGRDALKNTVMTYHGKDGWFQIVIDRNIFSVRPAV